MQRKWRRTWSRKVLDVQDLVALQKKAMARAVLPAAAAATIFVSAMGIAGATPTGGQITSGSGVISQNGTTTTISQTTDRLAINWDSFNIARGETVRFAQPGSQSVALNRVIGGDPSAIYGQLAANGKVFLINPNGVLFAPGAQVNVGGLVASTLNITARDFMSGKYTFVGNGGAVVNKGDIKAAEGGYVVLLGAQVTNEGIITAKGGTVATAAGNAITIDRYGDGMLNLSIDQGAVRAGVVNSGVIVAEGGKVLVSAKSADALAGTVVNNSGIIRATGISQVGGVIRLDGGSRGMVANSGTLDASGKVAGAVGGSVTVVGEKVALDRGTSVDASGDVKGGTVLIGGTFQGQGPEQNATYTIVNTDASIKADAVTKGNGGNVVVWADNRTEFAGTIRARGGAQGGDGGQVEVSGKTTLSYRGMVDVRAPMGKTGNLLLDPTDYTIAATGGDMTGEALATQLETANVTLLSSNGGSGTNGDIHVNDSVTWSSGNSLTLSAYRHVNVNQLITAGNNANVTLRADNTGTGTGTVNFSGPGAVRLSGTGSASLYYNPANYTLPYDYSPKIQGGIVSAYMLVRDANQLQAMGTNLSGNYALSRNIDASGTAGWNGGAGLVPVGNGITNYSGKFDGQNYTISGLTINRPTANEAGLFGAVGAGSTIANLNLANVTVTGATSVGALAGSINNSTVSNVSVTGNVVGGTNGAVGGIVGNASNDSVIASSTNEAAISGGGGSSFTGGVVGYLHQSRLSNVTNYGSVSGGGANVGMLGGIAGYMGNSQGDDLANYGTVSSSAYTVGGVVGQIDATTIRRSYNVATVTSNAGTLAGGIAGQTTQVSLIDLSYNTGQINGGMYTGGMVGQLWDVGDTVSNSYSSGLVNGGALYRGAFVGSNYRGTMANSYYNADKSGATSASAVRSDGVTALTDAQSRQQASYASYDWDFNNTFFIVDGFTTPLLRSEYSTNITNAHQLQLMAINPTATYTLARNIDASKTANSDIWGAAGFAPIGNATTPFTGTLEGNGVTISGLYINNSATQHVGLIGYASGATLRNLNITGVNITGTAGNTGALLGWGINTTINTVTTAGAVTGGQGDIAGVSGYMSGGSITNATNNASVSASGTGAAAGISGFVTGGALLSNVTNTGTITGSTGTAAGIAALFADGSITSATNTGSINGGTYAGGIVAHAYSPVTITASTNTGSISTNVNGHIAGGVVGLNQGSITTSSSSGAITATGTSAGYTGGLVGQNNTTGNISDSYSTGSVNGYVVVGGFAGYNAGSISRAYATGNVSSTFAGGPYIGGFTGVNNGTITNSYATGAVAGRFQADAGGFAGDNFGMITNAYATGSVTGTSSGYAGGFTGYQRGGTISNAWSSGYVSATSSSVGGFTGAVAAGSIVNSYWDITSSSQSIPATLGTLTGMTGLNTSQMMTRANFAGWDFANTWFNVDGAFRPILRSEYSTNITNAHQLQLMSMDLSATYTLGNNIDASKTQGGGDIWSTAGFSPIGNTTTAFTGTLNGNNYTVDRLFMNRPAQSNVALFGQLSGGSVRNLNLTNVDITGYHYVGAVAGGTSANAVIDRVTVGGAVKAGTGAGIGGIVGMHDESTVSNSTSTATVSAGAHSTIGGLVGAGFAGANISNSYATGAITAGDNSDVGGLSGTNRAAISNSYATGTVTVGNSTGGNLGYAGGLVGRNISGTISDSYSTSAVNGGAGTIIGGLAGGNDASVSRSYASGTVNSGNSIGTNLGYAGGLVGSNVTGTIADSYSTSAVTGGSWVMVGGLVGGNSASVTRSYSSGTVTGNGANAEIGGVAGFNSSTGTITESYSTGTVNGINGTSFVGGLVGYNTGTVARSYFAGQATAAAGNPNSHAGGLLGVNNGGTITNSYAVGQVNGNGYSLGGLVGQHYNGGTITNSYSSAAVSGSATYRGGLVGENTATITNSYWDTESSGQASSAGGTGLTTAQMMTRANFAGWDYANTWFNVDGGFRPLLRSEYSTTITNAHQLQLMAMDPTATYTLGRNIDASKTQGNRDVWSAAGFLPVGSEATKFTGTLDGAGKSITGLYINGTQNSGLFGWTNGATIRNVNVAVNITGNNTNAGAVAAVAENTTISGVATSGSVASSGNTYAGGIAARMVGGSITDSSSSATVTGSNTSTAGGLVGQSQLGSITNSYATGTVSVGTNGAVGGVVGNNTGGTVTGSYGTGNVSGGAGSNTGGLAGYNTGTVSDSYSTGLVSGTAAGAGGLVGINEASGRVQNSYSTATLTGGNGTSVGGLVGNNYGTVTGSRSSGAVTGAVGAYAGGLAGGNLGSITNSYSTSAVQGGADAFTGGLVGHNRAAGTISSSYHNTGTVTGGGSTGGLIGKNEGSITSSYSLGAVNSSNNATGLTGGLVGWNAGNIETSYSGASASGGSNAGGFVGSNAGTIARSYSYGSASAGANANVGGFAASNYGNINNSYSTSNYSGSGSAGVGGFIGVNAAAGSVANSYSTGAFSGTASYAGGFVGYNYGTAGSATSSYWDMTRSGSGVGLGGGTNFTGVTGLTSTQMMSQASFVGWDFTNIWGIIEGKTNAYHNWRYQGLAGQLNVAGADRNVRTFVDGRYLGQATTDANGRYWFLVDANTAAAGSMLLSYVAGDAVKASALQVSTGKTMADMNLTQNLLSVDGNGTNVSTAGFFQATAGARLTDALFTTSGNNVTLLGNTRIADTSGINIAGTLNAGANTLSLDSTGAVTQTGAITAGALELTGSGAYTLNNSANAIGTLAANAGSVSLMNTGVLNIGTAGSTTGIRTSGNATIVTGGNLTISGGASVTSTAGSISLVTTGGNFINSAGAGALSAPGGRWLVYSANPAADTRGGLDYAFKQYNTTYGQAILGTGNGFIYSVAPTITVALTGTAQKTYDGTTNATLGAANYSTSGGIDGDTFSYTSTANYADKNAGNGKNVTATGIAVTSTNGGKAVYGYTLGNTTATAAIGQVDKASMTITAVADTKTYDRTTTSGATPTVTGLVAGDTVTGLVEAFADRNAGTGKILNVTGYTINDGNGGNNYTVTTVSNNAGVIEQAVLNAGLTGTVSKVYDRTTDATIAAGNYNLTGVIAGDTVNLVKPTAGTYADRNAGTGKQVTVNGLAIDGADAGNYRLAATTVSGNVGTIEQATVTVGLTGTVSKVYDQTTDVALAAGNYIVAGVIGPDTVTLNNPSTGTLDNKNVGNNKAVTVNGLTIGGADAGNYRLAAATVSGNIGQVTPKTVTASLNGTVTKTYDTTTAATLAGGNYTLTGVIAGDTANLNSPTNGTYDNKNAGTGKIVTVNGLSLLGGDAGNYQLAATTVSGNVGTVDRATITIGLTGTASKVYDQTTDVALNSGNYTISGILGSDAVTLNNPITGILDNKNVGNNKAVTANGLALLGGDAGNYRLAATTASGNIGQVTPKTVTVSLSGTVEKTYDTTTAATLAGGNYNVSGIIAGDTVNLNNPTNGAYDNKNAGTGKTVTANGLALLGGDAGNYQLAATTVSGNVGTINKAALMVALTGTVNKTYDRTTDATMADAHYNMTGVIGADAVTLVKPTTGSYDNKNVGTGKTVTVSGLALAGAEAGNYQLAATTVSGAVGTIEQATVATTLTGSVTKTYDTTTAATLTTGNYNLTGVIAGDTVNLSNHTTGAYDNKNAGTGKTVTVNGLALAGADAANYRLASTNVSGNVGMIEQATVNVNLTGTVEKTYDRTTAATLTTGNYNVTGVLAGDTVNLNNHTTGAYDNKNAGTGKAVTVDGLGLTGADAGNYRLASTSVSGNIGTVNKAALMVALTGSVEKTYDAVTTANVAAGNYNVIGVIAGDSISVAGTSANYADKNAGAGKTVTVTGLGLAGADAGNYQLGTTTVSGNVGTIAKADLVVRASNATKVSGTDNPAFSANYSGFQGGESAADLGGSLSFSTTASRTSPAGSYAITPGGLTSGNYNIQFVAGTLEVSRAAVQNEQYSGAVWSADRIALDNRTAGMNLALHAGKTYGLPSIENHLNLVVIPWTAAQMAPVLATTAQAAVPVVISVQSTATAPIQPMADVATNPPATTDSPPNWLRAKQ